MYLHTFNIRQKKKRFYSFIGVECLNNINITLFRFYCYTPMSLYRFFDNKVAPFMKLYIDLAVPL